MPEDERSEEEKRIQALAKYTELDPPCSYCRHLQVMGDQDMKDWICPAFPEGIPYSILIRSTNHASDQPEYPGQKTDIRFDSKIYDTGEGKEKITFGGEWVPIKEKDK